MKTTKSEQEKTALITGATSGIGLELSRIMASQGHPLVLVSRNQDQLQRLSTDLHERFQNMDDETQRRSLAKLAALQDFQYIFTAHYGMTDNIKGAFENWRE